MHFSWLCMEPMVRLEQILQMPQKGQTRQEAKDSNYQNSSRFWRKTMLRSKYETDAGRYDHDINCWDTVTLGYKEHFGQRKIKDEHFGQRKIVP